MLKFLFFYLFIVYHAPVYEAARYRGYKVFKITPESKDHIEFLQKIRKHYSVNLWKEPHNIGIPILTHIQPELLSPLKNAFKEHEIKYSVVHEDLQSLIDYERMTNTPLTISQSEAFDFGIYNQYEEIKFLMAELSTKYPKLVKIERIGKTYENRPIHSLKISSGDSSNKSAIIIECGIHANEWSPVAVCAYLADQLIENYGRQSEITSLLDKYEFNIILVANPDGYVYTWTKDRMWRKSRSRSVNDFTGYCRGADVNRNFDIEHCGVGSSNDPCQNSYCGDEAFSEGESRALRDLMKSREGRTLAYFAIHSFSQFWMTPYGITEDLPPNYSELERVANIGMDALHKEYNTDYMFGTIFRTIYPASGSSIDYAYIKQGIKYAYALELRDTGLHGHFLPKEQILPMCIETFKGLVAAIKAM
ncbi:carboxypeptidase B-like [Parasteatoda tepidariorum]|uniref:carboxypeptidase B-like n=1 Tax=Parasteatoda tepidariorum TaxID=114398 RepID=UPI00077F85D4|nr:carboxypeptidase B-like [Parasteatoda tepidariorum]